MYDIAKEIRYLVKGIMWVILTLLLSGGYIGYLWYSSADLVELTSGKGSIHTCLIGISVWSGVFIYIFIINTIYDIITVSERKKSYKTIGNICLTIQTIFMLVIYIVLWLYLRNYHPTFYSLECVYTNLFIIILATLVIAIISTINSLSLIVESTINYIIELSANNNESK